MRKNLLQRKSEGFTIIEVMIVLAIAGLILLIVFLAVPALQRNAHNTSIKNDVSAVLGAVNEWSNNNNGAKLPASAVAYSAGTVTIGTGCTTAGSNCAKASVSSNISAASQPTTVPGTPTLGTIYVLAGYTCNGNTPTTTGATGRSVAAYFALEGGAIQCQAS
jgi:prepilin-type N-terminal cleavage/methylation domain-containing protein